MKTAFIGHRVIPSYVYQRIIEAIQLQINNGCKAFIMGTHGEFDNSALGACRELRNTYKDLNIEVVITSLNVLKKTSDYTPYDNVKTVMYEIEEAHFKQQITLSNKKMIDDCDTLICYVDTSRQRSGAKTTLRYAEKRGLKIVNLFCEEDNPFRNMSKEKFKDYLSKHISNG